MQTLYRIVRADGAEVFRGKRSRVLDKLATRKLRDQWSELRVQRGRFNPALRVPITWEDAGTVEQFTLGQ